MSFGITASSAVGTGSGGGGSIYATQALASSPLVYWRLDDQSGSVVNDISGNSRHGNYINPPVLNSSSILADNSSSSVYFDNTAFSRATIDYAGWMDVGSITITVLHLWDSEFASPAPAMQVIASRYWDDDTNRSWALYRQDNEYKFYYRGSGGQEVTISAGISCVMGRTYFIAAYAGPSGAGLRVYSTGMLEASATGAGYSVNPSVLDMVVAGCVSASNNIFNGTLQEFAWFGTILSTATLDALASTATAPQQQWVNRAAGVAPRNGTSDHTISFAPASAGNFLTAVVSGPMTSTAVSAGWTKRINAVLDTEMAVFTRNANAGDSTLTLTHNGSNLPLNYVVYEFPTGTAWVTGASNPNGNTPDVTGLPGTPVTVFTTFGMASQSPSNPIASTLWGWRWFEDVDIMTIDDGVTGGGYMTLGWKSHITATSASPSTTGYFGPVYTVTNPFNNSTGVTFALSIP